MLLSRILSKLPARNTNFSKQCARPFYDWKTRKETIFAPATTIHPTQGSPLAIVRLSGPRTSVVIETLTNLQVIRPSEHKLKSNHVIASQSLRPRHARLTKLYDPSQREGSDRELIDIGLLLWFPRPHSYTGEDSCELHVHGSQAILNRLLTTLGKIEGLRPAEPGEFTLRAVQNNKMDLLQAESLSELISSRTDQQRKLALNGLTGSTRKRYEAWINHLVRILAHLEASIDFGEDELLGECRVVGQCIEGLRELSSEIEEFIKLSSRCRDFMQNGARVVILGRPNAGKSTFMNILCRQEKSIVSDLSGTTRDVIEHSFELGGHMVTLCDTAGLKNLNLSERRTDESSPNTSVIDQHNSIEREGIKRALREARRAHLVMYIVDGSELDKGSLIDYLMNQIDSILNIDSAEEDQRSIISPPKALHLVINKIDLNNSLLERPSDYEMKLGELIREHPRAENLLIDHVTTTMISCRTQENVNMLIDRISSSLHKLQPSVARRAQETLSPSTEDDVNNNAHQNNSIESDYVNERHLSLLRSVRRHLARALQMDIGTIDEMAQHVRESIDYLSRIVGTVENEQVLDVIFKDFCIGK